MWAITVLHQVLPIPFNQPQIATASNPINGETSSYGFNVIPTETLQTYDGGNTDLRVPYLGFNNNSAFYKAEGISTYNALQFGLRKRMSNGLQITGAYTWSHTLDMQSGLGLFFNGNDPFNLHNSYATSSYDRTHVAIVQYFYELPKPMPASSLAGKFTNGWALSGVTVFESGQPYDGYDFSGAVGGIYYSIVRRDPRSGDAHQAGTHQRAGGAARHHGHRPEQTPVERIGVLRATDRARHNGSAVHHCERQPGVRHLRNRLRCDGPQHISRTVSGAFRRVVDEADQSVGTLHGEVSSGHFQFAESRELRCSGKQH